MTAPADLPRKVQQLNNDVDPIYEILHKLERTQGRHSIQLAEIVDAQVAQGTTLDEHAAILHRHTSTLAEHSSKLDQHTSTLAEHGSKLDRIITLLESR